jgi:hypothetical protein
VASLDEEDELIMSLSALTPGEFARIWVLGDSSLPREEDLALWRQERTWRLADGSRLALYEPEAASEVKDNAS